MPNATTVGRFAPSPTGNLHLGSLVTAVASYCLAKRDGGKWLLRIEDVDSQRCHPQFSYQILKDLERLGLYWDDEVRYQSEHLDAYHTILDTQLLPVTYGCGCSRKSIQQYLLIQHLDNSLNPYPRICIHKNLPRHHAIRLQLPDQTIVFFDRLQGVIWGNPQREHGDIVLRRRAENSRSGENGMVNYMLAAVVDDALQGVNQVVRGLDILPLTIPQLVLADYLNLPLVKTYYHLPILVNDKGQKLSKQTLAEPISPYPTEQLINIALCLLGQRAVDIATSEVMLQQAIEQWDDTPLVKQTTLSVNNIQSLIISPKT